MTHSFKTVDLKFLGYPQAIAAYVFPHRDGVALVETGPGSTLPALELALGDLGYFLDQVTDVFLTHIHLDHAGAAGAIARLGATVHVHPNGAPHMLDPEKLLSSAGRIYGADMDRLWGEFLPVPHENMNILSDGEQTVVGEWTFTAIDSPGHANHHFAYFVEDVCFTGDVAGIRLPGPPHIRLPMPPPELNLIAWRKSLARLRSLHPRAIAPTHFGVYEDPDWHLAFLENLIEEIDAWIHELMPSDPSIDEINQKFQAWTAERSTRFGLTQELIDEYEAANPTWMSAAGIQRYWKKIIQG